MRVLLRFGMCLLTLLVCSRSQARAQSEPLERAAQSYFEGEKRGGLLLTGMGVSGLAAGTLLIGRDSDFAQGMRYPLLGFGTLHLLAGGYVYFASATRLTDSRKAIAKDAGTFRDQEHQRMGGVQTQFHVLTITELILLAGGGILAGVGAIRDDDQLVGIGAGLSLEAAMTLGFDLIAARRADRYVEHLSAPVLRQQGGEGAGLMLVIPGRF